MQPNHHHSDTNINIYALFDEAFYELEVKLGLIKAGFNPNQPRVPAGQAGGGQWTQDYRAISERQRWENSETLQRHFEDHGRDFKSPSANAYAKEAQEFRARAIKQKLPTFEYPKGGKIVMYDPRTNTFGVYTRDGKTSSFYKPKDGMNYYRELEKTQIRRGGRTIHPLPPAAGNAGNTRRVGGGRMGGGDGSFGRGRLDRFNPFKKPKR